MDDETLRWALAQTRARQTGGIGTLGERTLHAALKYALEPDETYHEVKTEGFVADIARPGGIVEVQTGSFYPLQKKLSVFLRQGAVTVVYPIAAVKWIIWVDPETGELSAPHKSPRPQRVTDVLWQLYWLRGLLTSPEAENLTVRVLSLEMREYRLQNGWGNDGKRGSQRCERVPDAVLDETVLDGPQAVARLLPQLPEPFTAAQLGRALRLSKLRTSNVLTLLQQLGLVQRVGKQKNAYLYQKTKSIGKN